MQMSITASFYWKTQHIDQVITCGVSLQVFQQLEMFTEWAEKKIKIVPYMF